MQQSQLIDIAALSPLERIALADALYDGAMWEIEGTAFSSEELADIDRRIAQIESGQTIAVQWGVLLAERPGRS